MPYEEYKYKRQAISAARDLGYSDEVISQLRKATCEAQIERIMRMTRKGGCE